MANKRQRLARKRYKEENPQLFPTPPTPKDSSEKKMKKKSKLKDRALEIKARIAKKRKLGVSVAGAGGGGSGFGKKHPLRMPGMRPGESCFICKSADHIAKNCPEKAQWEKNKICLLCRQHGHTLKNCQEKSDDNDKKFCYNCGQAGHSLSKCPKPIENGGTRFASCFICNEQGHLSKNCPKNAHGVYPKGGSCKVCGEVTHLAKYCPNKGKNDSIATMTTSENLLERNNNSELKLQNIYRSGDDLEDDFIDEDATKGKANLDSISSMKIRKTEKNIDERPKKKGHKVVNFLG